MLSACQSFPSFGYDAFSVTDPEQAGNNRIQNSWSTYVLKPEDKHNCQVSTVSEGGIVGSPTYFRNGSLEERQYYWTGLKLVELEVRKLRCRNKWTNLFILRRHRTWRSYTKHTPNTVIPVSFTSMAQVPSSRLSSRRRGDLVPGKWSVTTSVSTLLEQQDVHGRCIQDSIPNTMIQYDLLTFSMWILIVLETGNLG